MVVAVDTNVLLDILEQRVFPASLALTADWVTEAAELAVTPQSRSELSDQHTADDYVRSTQGDFRTLTPSREAWQMKLHALQGKHSTARLEDKDLCVIAQAAASEADFLISRDEELLRLGSQIEQLTGLSPLSPDGFLLGFFGVPGVFDFAVGVAGVEQVPQPDAAGVGGLLGRGHQQFAGPIQGVVLAAAVAEGPLLHSAADLVEGGVAQPHHMERVRDLGRVGQRGVEGRAVGA